jgi:alpha-tubulin suppressor-like RCC1 family protein
MVLSIPQPHRRFPSLAWAILWLAGCGGRTDLDGSIETQAAGDHSGGTGATPATGGSSMQSGGTIATGGTTFTGGVAATGGSTVMPTITQMSLGAFYSCATISNGTVKCWGINNYGQLGDGTTTPSLTPVAVAGLSNAVQVAATDWHTCARLSDGRVQCWGSNISGGEIGDGTTSSTLTPVFVQGLSTAVQVSIGTYHSCSLLSDGTVRCWGYNASGELGDGTTNSALAPVAVQGLSSAVQITAGWAETCALLSDGTVDCWGISESTGSTTKSLVPLAVPGLSGVLEVTTGYLVSCARLQDSTVKCWGYNGDGELGNGTNDDSSTPVSVVGLSGVAHIVAGSRHACAQLSDGTVECWRLNQDGELGNGTTITTGCRCSPVPVQVSGISNAIAVSVGGCYTCALLDDGEAECWGRNDYGQLGDGTTINRSTPVTVLGLP